MRKALLLAIPLLVLACDREPVAPTSANEVAANFMNNPDVGNLHVFRYQTDVFAAWNDGDYRVTHRTQPAPGYGDCFEFAPAGAAEWNERVMGPLVAESRWMANVQGGVWITVRDLTQPGACAGNLLIAEGWGRLTFNDNDELAYVPNDRNNNNSYGYRAHGTLTAPDGTKVQYSGHAHVVWDPDTGAALSAQYHISVH